MDPRDKPIIITRAEANLRPPKRPPARVDHHPGVIVHCTAGQRPHDLANALARWWLAQVKHQRADGWDDIGYHFGVTPQGEVLEGRGRNVRGAHAGKGKGYNRFLGIVVQGRGAELLEPERAAIEWPMQGAA